MALAAALAVPDAPAEGQYFGQNKVRYDRFDFQVLPTERFDIYHYPEAEEAVRDAARMAERWYERLARVFEFQFRDRKPLILYADHPDFQQTNVLEGRIGEATGGVTEAFKDRIIMPFTGSYAETDHVLGHELVHAFQFEMATSRAAPGLSALFRLPLWVVEGQAEYMSLGRAHPLTAMWLRDAVLEDELPTLRDLNRDPRRYFPYRYGHAFWAYVGGRWGDAVAVRLFRASLRRGLEGGVREVLEVPADTLVAWWMTDTREAYLPTLEGRERPDEVGAPVLSRERTGGRLNLAPSVSPDGRYVAFLSERDLFTIDLYLADARTGRVLRRLLRADTDPHFDALSFVHSGAAWSPDGRKVAVVVFARGENRIAVVDVASGDVVRTIRLTGVGAVTDIAWSPDGGRLAASGLAGGTSDLYLVELEDGAVRALTRDRYARLQPAWSPDGQTLAFVTDRGPETDLELLKLGPYRIHLMDVETGRGVDLPELPPGRQMNPAFSPDGRSLYFLGEPDGFSDIFRVELETGTVYRVTRVATGVSGLTDRSRALSVAAEEGRVLFSVFHRGEYAVRALEAEDALGLAVTPEDLVVEKPGVLPPLEPEGTLRVDPLLADPEMGLPPPQDQEVRTYRPRLSLDYIGPVTIGVGVDRFGTMVGGSASAVFSDMLGDRWLGVALQAEGELRDFKDLGGQVFYQNRERRWGWGVGAARIPYRTGFTTVSRGPAGELIFDQVLQRVFVDQAAAVARYPFSTVRRAEFSLAATRLSSEVRVDRFVFVGEMLVGRMRERRPELEPDPLHLVQGSAALVGDHSYFGFTSPVRGGRWRLEVQPTLGSLSYVTGLADYRRYGFRRPFTLAFRSVHVGRYGRDAEDRRLTPFFLGQETLVRGYSWLGFGVEECTVLPGETFRCPEFERLQGSRIGVVNLELRAPLFGTEEFGIFTTTALPVEVAAFADAGVAWTSAEDPVLRLVRDTPERVPVFSVGATSRIALGGYLALEIFYAYPFQRPVKGGHLGFLIAPGW